ncbi:AraC family transcriptional regulator [Pseudooceanicola algae]|uniref:IS5 family transposase IS4811 n=1 Tax=Pseudooceanicola algae TaxID=1537215 RepID=A0A418SHA8_9RHOB|nr:AraC family transcriptional regulator [Pseudooceanicola algae]QPM90440.1 IS5 family transposase IS4811 [Pseudooceanicola algae]
MTDPLAEVVTLLQPRAPRAKVMSAAGPWRVERDTGGTVFHALVLAGSARLAVDARPPVILRDGDFVLVPAARRFIMESLDPVAPPGVFTRPVLQPDGGIRSGDQEGPANVQMLIGHCTFGAPDAALLVSLLPELIRISGQERLTALVRLVSDECRARRPAREVILERLLEVLFIEALRSSGGTQASPGLLRGLADDRIAPALRALHEDPAHGWTVIDLARKAALSRSAFFARFTEGVGMPPMEYLLSWRMSLARDMLRRGAGPMETVARRIGYGSASAFSTAFTRHVGTPPARFARVAGAAGSGGADGDADTTG